MKGFQQTNQQTNQQTEKEGETDKISQIRRVSEIIDSLDSLKKEIRSKFKKLTSQEMKVFTSIYQLEEKGFIVDYSLLAQNTSLSEISIRDYVRKIINKGIPLDKKKQDNKKIILTIPQNLKKIATINTITSLREL